MPELYIQIQGRIIRAEIEAAGPYGRPRRIRFTEIPSAELGWQAALHHTSAFKEFHLVSYERDLAEGHFLRDELDRYLTRENQMRSLWSPLALSHSAPNQFINYISLPPDEDTSSKQHLWNTETYEQRLLTGERVAADLETIGVSYSPTRLRRISVSQAYSTAPGSALERITVSLKYRAWLTDYLFGTPFELGVAFPSDTYIGLAEHFVSKPYTVSTDVTQFLPAADVTDDLTFVAVFPSGEARSLRTDVVISNDRTILVVENPLCLVDPVLEKSNNIRSGRILLAAFEVAA